MAIWAHCFAISQDMATVFSYMASRSVAEYPDLYRGEIEQLIAQWRPEIWARSKEVA